MRISWYYLVCQEFLDIRYLLFLLYNLSFHRILLGLEVHLFLYILVGL
jgi:hypothetical protein